MAMNKLTRICSEYQQISWRLPVWTDLRSSSFSALLYCTRHTVMTPHLMYGEGRP